MAAFDWSLLQETSNFAAYGDLDWFDCDKMMYNYDEVQRAADRIERMWEKRIFDPCDSVKDPERVRQIFRLYPHHITQLCNLLRVDLEHKTKRNNPLSVCQQVCTALLYYGTGKYRF